MDNAYTTKRREHILGLLNPQLTSEEQLEALSGFVEAEVRGAYRRGLRTRRGSTPARGAAKVSQCCHAPMIGGVQCEACGSDGKVED